MGAPPFETNLLGSRSLLPPPITLPPLFPGLSPWSCVHDVFFLANLGVSISQHYRRTYGPPPERWIPVRDHPRGGRGGRNRIRFFFPVQSCWALSPPAQPSSFPNILEFFFLLRWYGDFDVSREIKDGTPFLSKPRAPVGGAPWTFT